MPIEHILEPEVGWSSPYARTAREDTSDPISGIVLGVRFAQIRVEEPRRFAPLKCSGYLALAEPMC
jgi:hypothetical protein